MQEVQISVDGGMLAGALFVASKIGEAKQPGALLIHGWQSSMVSTNDTAWMLSTRLGITCLTIDLRGHGKSEGIAENVSAKLYVDDVVSAYSFLVEKSNVDPNNIGLVGSSFGSYLATLLSAQRKVAWMVLRVPADYPDETFELSRADVSVQAGMNHWRQQARDWSATAALRAIHAFTGPILLVEAEKDEIIPHQTVLNYKNATSDARNLQYVVMKDAPHSFTGHPDLKKLFNEMVYTWKQPH